MVPGDASRRGPEHSAVEGKPAASRFRTPPAAMRPQAVARGSEKKAALRRPFHFGLQ
jgi:hypothetical protein